MAKNERFPPFVLEKEIEKEELRRLRRPPSPLPPKYGPSPESSRTRRFCFVQVSLGWFEAYTDPIGCLIPITNQFKFVNIEPDGLGWFNHLCPEILSVHYA